MCKKSGSTAGFHAQGMSGQHMMRDIVERHSTTTDAAQVRIIVSGTGDWRYVDCVSIRGGKLEALERVRTLFSVPRDRCMAAGDSGNDILMLEGADSSCTILLAC